MDMLSKRFEEPSSIRQGKFRSQYASRLAYFLRNVKHEIFAGKTQIGEGAMIGQKDMNKGLGKAESNICPALCPKMIHCLKKNRQNAKCSLQKG